MGKKIKQIFSGQTPLPFNAKRGGVWAAGSPFERQSVVVLSGILFLIVLVYVYSIMTSVMHVAAREELSIEATRLSAEVAALEAEYLSRTRSITETYARAKGFVALSDRSFVEKVSALSVNTSR